MAEPTDAILPILQRIQSDIADTRRDLGQKLERVEKLTAANTEILDASQKYFYYQLGMTTKTKPMSRRSRKNSRTSKNALPPLRRARDAATLA